MKILIACEFSGTVRNAFIEKGHEAVSCDLLPTESPGPHYQGDVFDIINQGWDMLIAFPPCTYLTKAGARWLYSKGLINQERFEKGLKAKEFFMKLFNSNIPKICIENPTPLKIWKLPNYSQAIQPYMFGHPFTKRTLFWLKNLPPLSSTNTVKPRNVWCPSGGSGNNRKSGVASSWKQRSKTFEGVAEAMASQWTINKKYYKQTKLFI